MAPPGSLRVKPQKFFQPVSFGNFGCCYLYNIFFLCIIYTSLCVFLNPIYAGGGPLWPSHINFVDNFFIVERINLKFGVNSYLSFSDHMKFFRVRFRSQGGQDMGSKVRGGHPKLAIFDKNRYKIRFSRQETDFLHN